MRGRIKRFIEDKGFGFITGEDGEDYFFHISQVRDAVELKSWMIVNFDIIDGKKGKNAANIRVSTTNTKFITCGNINIRLSNIKEYGMSSYPVLYEKVYQEYMIKSEKFLDKLFWRDGEKPYYKFEGEWVCHGEIDPYDIEYFTENAQRSPRMVNNTYIRYDNDVVNVRKKVLVRDKKNVITGDAVYAPEEENKNIYKVKYLKYLYIETYQKENFQFKEDQVSFNIYDKYNEINNAMKM